MDTEIKRAAGGADPLPDAEAVLAGTLALMTGHAQSGCPQRRLLMALKIRHNLDQLQRHPDLGAPLRIVLQRLCHAWGTLAGGLPAAAGQPDPDRSGAGAGAEAPARLLWLPTPGLMQ